MSPVYINRPFSSSPVPPSSGMHGQVSPLILCSELSAELTVLNSIPFTVLRSAGSCEDGGNPLGYCGNVPQGRLSSGSSDWVLLNSISVATNDVRSPALRSVSFLQIHYFIRDQTAAVIQNCSNCSVVFHLSMFSKLKSVRRKYIERMEI